MNHFSMKNFTKNQKRSDSANAMTITKDFIIVEQQNDYEIYQARYSDTLISSTNDTEN